MIRLPQRARQGLRRFVRSDAGTASIEFVMVFPVLMLFFFASFEIGYYSLRQTMLERALNMTTRVLRLGQMTNPTNASLVTAICNIAGPYITNCNNVLMVELRDVSTSSWTPLSANATCVNRGAKIQPVTTVTQGSGNDIMIIRVCAIVQPLFPGIGVGLALPKDSQGGYDLIATSAFVNEPS